MDHQPLVSVIVPVYNGAHFLDDTIANLQKQTYTNLELIFVDDCSTDTSLNVLEKYKKDIIILQHESNKGCAGTRNTGIAYATGEFIAFLDYDDKWHPQKIEKWISVFNEHKDIDFGFSDFRRYYFGTPNYYALTNSQLYPFIYESFQDQTYIQEPSFVISAEVMFPILLRGYPMFPSVFIIRKRLFDRCIWDEALTPNDDFDLALMATRYTDFLYFNEALSDIGRHDTNVSKDIVAHMERDMVIYEKHECDTYYSQEKRKMITKYKARRACSLGRHFFWCGNVTKALYYYKKAFSCPCVFIKGLCRLVLDGINGKK